MKITLFINSATALRKTSGSDLMTIMQTETGAGQITQNGLLQPGPGWSILVTGGSRIVVTCLLWMEPWEEEVTQGASGTLSCAPLATTLYVSNQ